MHFLKKLAQVLAFIFCTASAASAATSGDGECLSFDSIPSQITQAPLLVFGEVHGTEEIPRFVISYLCAATANARAVTLAMEIPEAEQQAIEKFLASQGDKKDIEQFLSSHFWKRDMQDGRSSVAMFHLFEKIRTMRVAGAKIRAVAIDSSTGGAKRDAVMSSNLRAELGRNIEGQVVALIGGLHAARSKGNRFNPNYESAIYLLTDKNPIALTVGTLGGTAWVCKSNQAESCHATEWDINRVTPPPKTALSLSAPSEQFDGVFFVGSTTASPPAIEALKRSSADTIRKSSLSN